MLLEFKNITVQSEGKMLVNNAAFSLRSGEVAVLMGENGSGKSSLVNGIFSHPKYNIADGKILLDHVDITNLSPDKKARIGLFLSPQHIPEIDGVTFLNFFYRAYKEIKNLSELSIMEFKNILETKSAEYGLPPRFLKHNVNAGLSGGEKKQCETFQLALFAPKFAFLDEIDSGVDAIALEKIFSVIRALKENGTGFLIITHYEKMLEKIKPDNVYAMKDGILSLHSWKHKKKS